MTAHLKAFSVVVVAIAIAVGLWIGLSGGGEESVVRRGMESLPELRLTTVDGREFSSLDLGGRVLIVNFWASWCGPCVEEIPSLTRLSKVMADDLRILAISGDSSLEDVQVFMKSFPDFQRPGVDIVLDTGLAVTRKFDVARLPESFIFDGNGRMVRKVVGTIDWSSPDAIEFLKNLRKK